jgi:bis(5'-nucleosyl)-tetraphosphatase (symmetrical)
VAVYAIGDLQGCLDPLQRLLERINFDPASDRLWFTGDLVNRGSQSLQTLRFVRDLGERAVTVLGNHDIHLLAVGAGHARTRATDTLRPILEADDGAELLDWLRHCPVLHEDASVPGYVLVHAGIAPQWDLATARASAAELETALRGADFDRFLAHLYGDEPVLWHPQLRGWDRLRFITNAFTRMRYCAPDGRLLLHNKDAPDRAPPDQYPWFEVPGRRPIPARLIFGHWSTLGLRSTPDVLALDTGCVWGGQLTAARLGAHESIIATDCEGELTPAPGL